MRTYTKNEQPTTIEATFKSSKKRRIKGHKEQEWSDDEWDEKEEANFVRKLKRGTRKYKSKLPFKCFNCGRIGHYDKKYPFEQNKGLYNKKSLYSKEDISSSDESDGQEGKLKKFSS